MSYNVVKRGLYFLIIYINGVLTFVKWRANLYLLKFHFLHICYYYFIQNVAVEVWKTLFFAYNFAYIIDINKLILFFKFFGWNELLSILEMHNKTEAEIKIEKKKSK